METLATRARHAAAQFYYLNNLPWLVTPADLAAWRAKPAAVLSWPLPSLPGDPPGWWAAGEYIFRMGAPDNEQTAAVKALLEGLAPGDGLSIAAVDPLRGLVTVACWRRVVH